MKGTFISAIVVAGGSGKRFDYRLPKQFVLLAGKPIICHSLDKLTGIKEIVELILVVPRSYLNYCRKRITRGLKTAEPVKIVAGGRSRQESVSRGLMQVNPRAQFVLVHDAVRPLVTTEKIQGLIKTGMKKKAAISAVPVKDTVKQVGNNVIEATHSREKLWLAQTPQIFAANLIKQAYRKAEKDGFAGTDCASLVERLGIKVSVVEGSSENLKITSKADLRLAEALIRMRKNA